VCVCVQLCVQTAGYVGTLKVTMTVRGLDLRSAGGTGAHWRSREVTGFDCLQSKCATCCAMAPRLAGVHSPRAARPTPDSTPLHTAGTNAENFPPAERSLAVSRSVLFTKPRLE